MPNAYRIKDWDKIFENNESRKLKNLNWVPLPNSWEGLGYARVTKHKNAVTILAAWPLVVQIGSKCPQRGLLAKVDAPLSVEDMTDLTRMPVQMFERALEALADPLIGWIEVVEIEKAENGRWEVTQQRESRNLPQSPDASGSSGVEQNRTERNRKEGEAQAPVAAATLPPEEEIVRLWNSESALPAVRNLSSDRNRSLKSRMKETFFRENFPDGIKRISVSAFCLGESEQGWRATFDWFLKPGNLEKILEGKYDGRQGAKTVALRDGEHPDVWDPMSEGGKAA